MSQVRVSIGNLAWYARNVESGSRFAFGIFNPKKLKQGERQVMALGGSAMLNDNGKAVLEDMFGAAKFEQDKNTGFFDARFHVDEQYLEQIFEMFKKPSAEFENDPTLDILTELASPELLGVKVAVGRTHKKPWVKPVFLQSVRQGLVEAEKDTSNRVSAETPTRRLFRIYELQMIPHPALAIFSNSRMVRYLSDDEMRTTDGGRTAGKTSDGDAIQNNLFLI